MAKSLQSCDNRTNCTVCHEFSIHRKPFPFWLDIFRLLSFTVFLHSEIKMSCSTTICRLNCKWIDMDTRKTWRMWFFRNVCGWFNGLVFAFSLFLDCSFACVCVFSNWFNFRCEKNFKNAPKTCTSWERPLRYDFFRFHSEYRQISNSHQTIPTMGSNSMWKQNKIFKGEKHTHTHTHAQQVEQTPKNRGETEKFRMKKFKILNYLFDKGGVPMQPIWFLVVPNPYPL